MISVEIDREIEERLEALGATTDSSKTGLSRERLIDALEEDLRDLNVAKRRLEEPAKRWTQEELEQGLDLEGRVGRLCSQR